MRRHIHQGTSERRGVILIVVLIMLTLFSVVGLMAVLYAQNSSRSSGNFAKGWQLPFRGTGSGDDYAPPDIPPQEMFRWALGQLVYPVDDSAAGVQSSIRGHELSRTMYGYSDSGLNTQPFNGMGRFDFTYGPGPLNGQNDRDLINYTYFPGFPLRDPEYPGSRANPTLPRGGGYVGGANPPITYPDLDNLVLAAARADGTNLMPSMHRPFLFGNMTPPPGSPGANPNWTNPEGRFKTLRPRPADNLLVYPDGRPGFPYPADSGGDVKNKLGAPGGNDSIWIDLGYPERVAPDGRRFKPLFAFRVEDLDNRINLNVAGNLMGGVAPNETHGSNQGWGIWEQSIMRILNSGAAAQEWRNLFVGNSSAPSIKSRYGADRVPSNAGASAPGGKYARFFGRADDNATDEYNNFAPTGLMQFLASSPFPVFANGYGSGDAAARQKHARLFNYFDPSYTPNPPATFDGVFPISDMRKLLTGLDLMSANVVQLAPQNLALDPQAARRRQLVTLLSMDMGRLGVAPWLYERGAQNGTGYASPADPQAAPSGGAVGTSFQDAMMNNRLRRAAEATMEAVNLDQELRPYPHQTSNTGPYNIRFDDGGALQTAFVTAQQDRQSMAADIFKRLLLVTGVPMPADASQPQDAELIPIRWMAQLATNIVDFIDEDEISTPFNFYPVALQYWGISLNAAQQAKLNTVILSTTTAAGEKVPRFWVFGTELPPVVLNEAYVEFDYMLDPLKVEMSGPFDVRVWAELYNPFPKVLPTNPMTGKPTVQYQDSAEVPLYYSAGVMGTNPYSPYKLVVSKAGGPLVPRADNDNVNGVADNIRTQAVFNSPSVPRVDKVAPDPQMAVNPQQANGFFLMGPQDKTRNDTIKPARVPGDVPYFQTPQMKWKVQYTKATNKWTDPVSGADVDDRANGVTVLLRRLANPHLPEQDDPNAGAYYNPYVTLDYIDNVQINDVTSPKSDMTVARSQGKKQPYASERGAQIDNQVYGGGDPLNQHTLGVANSNTTGNNYNWLVHLDRQLVSAFELLNVSGYRPHMLTQKFNAGFNQRVWWLDEDLAAGQSHRLYRLFAFLSTSAERFAGVSPNGRIPGKININTIWDKEVFDALCDASASNTFTQVEVNNVWAALSARTDLNNRRPVFDLGAAFLPAIPMPNSDPVAGPNGRGLDDTYMKLFQTGNGNPYLKNELLTKIGNSVTTRSNVFAVWLTTGFFEVVNHPLTGLPVLGEEIGRGQGTEKRYRFFAIVDRSQLAIAPQLTSAGAAGPIGPSLTPQTVSVGTLSGSITYNGGSTVGWSIGVGSIIVLDRGMPSEETVTVTAVDTTMGTFSAIFRRAHAASMTVTMHGNPGPQPNWDPAAPGESLVFPYWEQLN